jgi:hypothetical protein
MAFYDAAKSLNEGVFTIVVIVLSIYLVSLGRISTGDILVYAMLLANRTNPLARDSPHPGSRFRELDPSQ